MNNTGSALLLVGVLWFGYSQGFQWWLVLLGILAIATWVFATGADEQKKLWRAQTDYYYAKTRYLERSLVKEKKAE